MVQIGRQLDEITCNTYITRFLGNLEKARDILQGMPNKGCKIGIVTYNTIINGLCKRGRLEEGQYIFYEMLKQGLNLDVVTYNALMDGPYKGKQ